MSSTKKHTIETATSCLTLLRLCRNISERRPQGIIYARNAKSTSSLQGYSGRIGTRQPCILTHIVRTASMISSDLKISKRYNYRNVVLGVLLTCLQYKQEHHPQHWCERCRSLFPTLDLLKYHWSTSAVHLDSRCLNCREVFMTPAELEEARAHIRAFLLKTKGLMKS